MGKIQAYKAFVAVANTKSFSKAAEQLHLSQPSISRIITDLEHQVQKKLFNRKTNRTQLTFDGASLYEKVVPWLHQLDVIENDIKADGIAITGTIRCQLPIFMQKTLYPVFTKFLYQNPNIKINFTLSNSQLDLSENGFDCAIRLEKNKEHLQYLNFEPYFLRRLVFVGTPGYFKQRGFPKHPKELMKHNCLKFTPYGYSTVWDYQENGEKKTIEVTGQVQATSMLLLVDLVELGLGITCVPIYYVQKQIKSGMLQTILDDYCPEPTPVYIVTPKEHVSRPVQALVRYLLDNVPILSGKSG